MLSMKILIQPMYFTDCTIKVCKDETELKILIINQVPVTTPISKNLNSIKTQVLMNWLLYL